MVTASKPSRSQRTIGIFEAFYEFADRSRIFRRLVLYCILGLTLYCFWWSTEYATKVIEHPELATAAIIGAILTPAAALLGKVFQWYNEGRIKQAVTKDT